MAATTPSLRPLGAGDILDQAIRLYRKNFATLVGVVAVVTVPVLLFNLANSLISAQANPLLRGSTPFLNPSPATFSTLTFVSLAFSLVLLVLSSMATVFQAAAAAVVVSERYLGRAISIAHAYREALRRWLSLLIAYMLLVLVDGILFAFFIVPFFFAGLIGAFGSSNTSAAGGAALVAVLCACVGFFPILIVLVFLNVHWIFATQAIVLENQNSTGGLRRSWQLVRGSFWRVLGILFILVLFLYAIIYTPVIVFQTAILLVLPPSLLFLSLVLNLTVTSLMSTLVLPLLYSVLTLLYYDLRIRKEGFDLEQLAQAQPSSLPDLSGAPA